MEQPYEHSIDCDQQTSDKFPTQGQGQIRTHYLRVWCEHVTGYTVVTLLPPISEVSSSKLPTLCGRVGNRWLAVYGTKPQPTVCTQVSSARKTTHPDMTCTVLKVDVKALINK